MNKGFLFVAAVVAIVISAGVLVLLRKGRSKPYVQGGVYSIKSETGFGVVKIIAVDGEAVHVRLYKNKLSSRPDKIDPDTLKLGTIHDPDGFGVGHLPLSPREFSSWSPVFVQGSTVSKDEMIGYEEWKKSRGGIWGGEQMK